MMDGFSAVIDKLKLGRHYKIERFGVLSIFLAVCLAFTGAGAFAKYQEKQNQKLSSDAIYTVDFRSSLTRMEGSVTGVYVNADKTRAFIMMKLEDVENRSLDASDYQVFLSAYRQKMLSRPTGSIYSFGMSGYLGVFLSDVDGFPTQVLDLVVRSNTELLQKDEGSSGDFEDSSFAEFDQFEVYFNPGAADAVHAVSLDADQLSVSDMYKEMVADAQESALKDELNSKLSAMQVELARIQEYERRLPEYGLAVPEDPEPIQGDSVDGPDEDGNYRLSTKHILSGGFDVDWQKSGITDGGYLKKLAHGEDAGRYLTWMAALAKEDSSSLSTPAEYYRTDGSVFDMSQALLPNDKAARQTVQSLENSWQAYYSLKQEYQVSLLWDLLLMEYQSDMTDEQFTVNEDSDLFILWDQVD